MGEMLNTSNEIIPSHTYVTYPNNSPTNIIGNNLNKLDIKTATLSTKMIHDLLHLSP